MDGLEYCRKSRYFVDIERPLLGTKGKNILEGNKWQTTAQTPYVVTGTLGEKWVVNEENLKEYKINKDEIRIAGEAIHTRTKNPEEQSFMVAKQIPVNNKDFTVMPAYGFDDYGFEKKDAVLKANDPKSKVDHLQGDWCVAKDINDIDLDKLGDKARLFRDSNGKLLQYMELPEEVRNSRAAAMAYDPVIVNGSVMENTYDHAKTKDEILDLYNRDREPIEEEPGLFKTIIDTGLEFASIPFEIASDYYYEAKEVIDLHVGKDLKRYSEYNGKQKLKMGLVSTIRSLRLEALAIKEEENEIKEIIGESEYQRETFMDKVKRHVDLEGFGLNLVKGVAMVCAFCAINYKEIVPIIEEMKPTLPPANEVVENSSTERKESVYSEIPSLDLQEEKVSNIRIGDYEVSFGERPESEQREFLDRLCDQVESNEQHEQEDVEDLEKYGDLCKSFREEQAKEDVSLNQK